MFALVSIGVRLLPATLALALAPSSGSAASPSALPAQPVPQAAIASFASCSTTLSHAESREFLRALMRAQYQIRLDLGRLRRLALVAEQATNPPGFHLQADVTAQRLVQHIDAIARSAQFGKMHIADGSVSWVCIQISPTDASGVRFSMQDCTVPTQGLDSIDLTTSATANLARADIEAAISTSENRGRYLRLVSTLLNE
jgi:hypothetical protein